jgi:hypothetical protein
MATTTTNTATTYTPSLVKYSDFVHAGLNEALHQFILNDRKANFKHGVESAVYRVGGRLLNNQITTPIPMILWSEDDMFTGIVAGLDSSLRKGKSASKAAMDAFYEALTSYLAVQVHLALKIDDKYII